MSKHKSLNVIFVMLSLVACADLEQAFEEIRERQQIEMECIEQAAKIGIPAPQQTTVQVNTNLFSIDQTDWIQRYVSLCTEAEFHKRNEQPK